MRETKSGNKCLEMKYLTQVCENTGVYHKTKGQELTRLGEAVKGGGTKEVEKQVRRQPVAVHFFITGFF